MFIVQYHMLVLLHHVIVLIKGELLLLLRLLNFIKMLGKLTAGMGIRHWHFLQLGTTSKPASSGLLFTIVMTHDYVTLDTFAASLLRIVSTLMSKNLCLCFGCVYCV